MLAAQHVLRPRTRDWYELALRVHLKPRLGRLRISAVGPSDVARVIGEMQSEGCAAWTIRGVLVPLGRVMAYAVRNELAHRNLISMLERGERPRAERRDVRVLSGEEVERLLAAASPRYRPIIAATIFTGARQGELLGLAWEDVRFEEGAIRIRRQLDRSGCRVEPKTRAAVRDVVMMGSLRKILRAHRLASPFSKPSDFVFASVKGGPMHYRNVVRRGLEKALDAVGLPRLRRHDLRHCFASYLITEGLDVVFVSEQRRSR